MALDFDAAEKLYAQMRECRTYLPPFDYLPTSAKRKLSDEARRRTFADAREAERRRQINNRLSGDIYAEHKL
jgi:hypothetical protein